MVGWGFVCFGFVSFSLMSMKQPSTCEMLKSKRWIGFWRNCLKHVGGLGIAYFCRLSGVHTSSSYSPSGSNKVPVNRRGEVSAWAYLPSGAAGSFWGHGACRQCPCWGAPSWQSPWCPVRNTSRSRAQQFCFYSDDISRLTEGRFRSDSVFSE